MSRPRGSSFEKKRHRGDEPHLLREVVRTYQVLMTMVSRELGMPASRFALMRFLAVAETEVGVMDLARQMGVNAAAITRQVQELERERLVRRRADPNDRRRSYLSLSPKGRKLFEVIHGRNHELERSLSSVLGAEEMRTATMVLTKLQSFVLDLR